MNETDRPDPDALLASLNKQEKLHQRGHLKIFFGMSAGVGKTYAMLRAAQDLKTRGVNVVAGLVETHGRKETEALLNGLQILPRKVIDYRDVQFHELDLDEVLRTKPEYAIIDELAHTNVEGMRHAKRYQDVLEMLENGINVFTTLNVQHVESLVDAVQEITKIAIRETVPDSIIDAADQIELIDLSPDDLLKRLAEGKVYTADRTAEATENFFRKGNLTALREIALRKTAQRVDSQLKDYMQEHRISGPWKTIERLMVAIGPSPYSEQLIRWTRRIASVMEAPWIAVYVQTTKQLNSDGEKRLKKNIDLAEELGAELVTTTDDDIAKALIRTARRNNVTQIIIGKSTPHFLADTFQGGSLVNKLIRESGGIDIYVVQSDLKHDHKEKRSFKRFFSGSGSPAYHYIISFLSVIIVSAVCGIASPVLDFHSIGMVFLFCITILSLFVGKGPIFAAATLGALIWDFFFIPPHFTFSISSQSDIFLFSLYFVVALITGTLTSRARSQQQALWRRERQSSALYALVNELTDAESVDDIAAVSLRHIEKEFDSAVAFFPQDSTADLQREPHAKSTFQPETQNERAVAEWVFKNMKPAGKGTSTLPSAQAAYYPLLANANCLGVIGIVPRKRQSLSFGEDALFHVFLQQIALSLERLHLRSDRYSKTLLRSISHELRTPISVITGASSGLSDPTTKANDETQKTLLADIQNAAQKLNRLVENFLNMSRIESGALPINRDWCDISELFEAVLQDLQKELSGHSVKVKVQKDLPLFKLDAVLLQQAITNLMLNASQYTPENSPVYLSAEYDADTIVIKVEDEGQGIPAEALPFLFEKFYRVPGTKAGGTGLGLSIVKSFVELHGGTVEVGNKPSGGTEFKIRIPARGQTISLDGVE
jgi:two-component system, OmpR family, sensor histidine kinase KdpD